MYIWDCDNPPFRPSVSPLPSYAVRPLTRNREDGAKSDWVKRAAQRLQAMKGRAAGKKPE